MASRSFPSKHDGICAECFGLIRAGDKVRFNDDGKIMCAGRHVTMAPMFRGE